MEWTARRAASRSIVAWFLLVLVPLAASGAAPQGHPASGLPLPHELPLQDYERVLYKFLFKRVYASSPYSWTQDKEIRDTGPYIGGLYYGSHPAVRIYYSPEVMAWLAGGRRGEVADGGMIIKEMFPAPAALYLDPVVGAPPPKDPSTGASPLDGLITGWTVMVKDRSIAKGGWFYAGPSVPKGNLGGLTPSQIEAAIEQNIDNYNYPFNYPTSGVALGSCQRCHASATNELTFASLVNVQGFPGQPIRFRDDGTWRATELLSVLPAPIGHPSGAGALSARVAGPPRLAPAPALPRELRARTDQGDLLELQRYVMSGRHRPPTRPRMKTLAAPGQSAPGPDPAFVAAFPLASPTDQPRAFPGQWADRVVAGPGGAEAYITSDNCMGCHGGLGGAPYNVTMFVKTGTAYGDGFNLSEFGEWRWSPMGLAGRDPIFHAQIESELAILDREFPPAEAATVKTALINVCTSCHGAMGQRQLALDAGAGHAPAGTTGRLDPDFKLDYFYLTTALDAEGLKQKDYEYHKYGNLAREGVSCTICHHIVPPDAAKIAASKLTDLEYFLMNNTTGRFERGPDDVLNGPFEKVAVLPMQASLGITPKRNDYVKDSRLCGSCHAINLPNVDATFPGPFHYLDEAETVPAFKKFPHSIEQATYLEWENSAFADKANPGSYKSCQDCHMPGGFVSADKKINLPQVVTQIATIEDTSYPMVDHGAPAEAIYVPVRGDYRRHELVGLNVFLEEMFNQFDPILGVAQSDFMTSATNGNIVAIDNMVRQARETTVDLGVKRLDTDAVGPLVAEVTVTNKVGHRFPSGVGFRRAFLEVLATRKSTGEVVWGSGRTDSVGLIVDGHGRPLPTEFLPDAKTFQPHYQEISDEEQVQIYEELSLNAKQEFSTSFIHRDTHPKDNRLLARGWLSGEHLATKSPIVKQFLLATDPEGASVLADPDFGDNGGKGASGIDHIKYNISLPAGVNKADVVVKATMYYQAIPPYYLLQRFRTAPDGEATRRLYYMTSHLATRRTPIENWKLMLATATTDPTPQPGSRAGIVAPAGMDRAPRMVDRALNASSPSPRN